MWWLLDFPYREQCYTSLMLLHNSYHQNQSLLDRAATDRPVHLVLLMANGMRLSEDYLACLFNFW